MRKRILVVEDNLIAAKVAKGLLELLNCQVDCVDDGHKAVANVLSNNYDGICMDIGLPTLSGIEACKAIRAHETKNHLKKVPIIALTANCRPHEVAEYLKAGMQEALSKPFTKEKAVLFLSFCN